MLCNLPTEEIDGASVFHSPNDLEVFQIEAVNIDASSSAESCESTDKTGGEEILLTSLIRLEDIIGRQTKCGQLRELTFALENLIPVREWPESITSFKSVYHKLSVVDGVIWFAGRRKVVVVPNEMLVDLVVKVHKNMAHIGRDKLINLVLQHVWHPQLRKVCQDVCSTCSKCQLMKVSRQCYLSPTLKIVMDYPFQLFAIDIILFPKLKGSWIGCVVCIDHNSKWACAVPITNKSSKAVADVFEFSILPFLSRVPEKLLSDNGLEFTGEAFEGTLERYGIKHILATPYRPSGNGCVERMNRTLGDLLRNLDESGNWRGNLTKALVVYNSTYHREIKMSPSQYLLSLKHESRDSILLRDNRIANWKPGHPKLVPFEVGNHVIKRIPKRGHSTSNKFSPKHEGPYQISRVNDNGVTYELVDKDGNQIRAHHSQLVLWRIAPEYLEDFLKDSDSEEDIPCVADKSRVDCYFSSSEVDDLSSDISSSVFEFDRHVSESPVEGNSILKQHGDDDDLESLCFDDGLRSSSESCCFETEQEINNYSHLIEPLNNIYSICSISDDDKEDSCDERETLLSCSAQETSEKSSLPAGETDHCHYDVALGPMNETWEFTSDDEPNLNTMNACLEDLYSGNSNEEVSGEANQEISNVGSDFSFAESPGASVDSSSD